MKGQKIAIVGSGVSGLSAAWLLSKTHQVTLYEADSYVGGHANTVDVETAEGTVPVDTGFIVFNEANYPNLTALFDHLGVESHFTEMTFALSLERGRYEYSGTGATGYFGQKRNLANIGHWGMLIDLLRFFRSAQQRLSAYDETVTLGDFLRAERYSDRFIFSHIIPLGAAIWSTDAAAMLDYPARTIIDFYANHGLLRIIGRPVWRTVRGGSRAYVNALLKDGGFEVMTGNPVQRISRHGNHVHIADSRGTIRPFDHVVLATHADQALKLIENPSTLESELLGSFSYQRNHAVLHRDKRFMPKRRGLWSAWNYLQNGHAGEEELCVTYWMNELQDLQTRTNLFVTLNPKEALHPEMVEQSFDYDHPVFDNTALRAQRDLWMLQGQQRTWFCGAHFGHGFHEDGARSGLAVAEALGGIRRPWPVSEPVPANPIPAWPAEAAE